MKHMTVTAGYLIRLVMERKDWRNLLGMPEGSTEEAVIASLRAGPAVLPVGTCDGFNYTAGKCPGHPDPSEASS